MIHTEKNNIHTRIYVTVTTTVPKRPHNFFFLSMSSSRIDCHSSHNLSSFGDEFFGPFLGACFIVCLTFYRVYSLASLYRPFFFLVHIFALCRYEIYLNELLVLQI